MPPVPTPAENALLDRFSKAILSARALPTNLLTQAQKLKLYALFQQASKGPPPGEAPEGQLAELDRAKWEAWHDVRGLTNHQAMESYSQIIENLEELVRETLPSPVPQPQWGESGGTATGSADDAGYAEEDGDEDDDDAGDDDDDEEGGGEEYDEEDEEFLAYRLVSEEREPPVTATVWSTAAISVGAGTKLDVPLSYERPSRCTYSFSIVSGSGPVGFKINTLPPREVPLLDLYQSAAEGTLEVEGPAVLMATLDNTAAVMSAVELRCRVDLHPLAELEAHAKYEERQNLRRQLDERIAAVSSLGAKAATQRAAVGATEKRLAELRRAYEATEIELGGLDSSLRASEEEQRSCRRQITQLKQALVKTLEK